MRDKLRLIASSFDLHFFSYAAVTLAIYVVASRLSHYFDTVYSGTAHSIVPLVWWPPAGIALAAIIFGGYRFAFVIALGSFISQLMLHSSPGIALSIALGTGIAMLIARLVLVQLQFDSLFMRLQDSLGLVFAALLSTLIGSMISSLGLYLEHAVTTGVQFEDAWISRWITMALGMLIVTPFLVRWLPYPLFRVKRTPTQMLDFFGSLGLLTVLDFFTYWSKFTSIGPLPIFYLTLLPLMWIALRVGPRAMTLALFLTGAIAVSGTAFGAHPVATPSLESLVPLQILLGMLAVLFLILVGLEEERKEGRQKLQEHVTQLEEALLKINSEDKSKNEFIAILAHELRNPLAPVLSALELLKIDEQKLDRLRMIESAEEQIKVMRRLLDDLLDISRMTQKKFRLKRELATLQSALRQSIQMAEPFIKARKHLLEISIPEESLWLFADPARLTQIFSNLLFNAAKYTEPGRRIMLSVEKRRDEVTVRVTDNGIGMRQEMLVRIFEPFVQYQQHVAVGSGLGLGLSLTKRLVEMHGGSINAQSEGIGQGSIFTVTLPLSSQVSTLQLPVGSSFPHKKAQRIRILVVDDNVPAAIGLSKLLQLRGGHTVKIAHAGEDALKLVDAFKPQVIILDIGLPDLDGYSVARRLRQEKGYQNKIIALTGYGQEEDKYKAREAGFDHHLTKPVGFAEVERILDRLTFTTEAAAPALFLQKRPQN